MDGRMHRRARFALVVAMLLGPIAAPASGQGGAVTGTVFVDANANGRRDAGERGVGGIAVSNQDAVVVTDASGAYNLPSAGLGVVFVSVPSGYRASGSFWRATSGGTTDFGVVEQAPAQEFTFVHASDTHVSAQSLPRLQRLRAMVDSVAPAFALITGDLIRDALRVQEPEARGYYELFEREAGQFRMPVYTVPGNHEIFGIERHLSGVPDTHPLFGKAMYRSYRGPDYYSFDYGGVHFVALNTVDIHDGQWYRGHVDSLQLEWLRRDLALVPAEMPVVSFDHIPFFSTGEIVGGYSDRPPAPTLITVGTETVYRHTVANAAAVLAVLRARRHVLALAGHIHARELLRYGVDGTSVRFETSAATVGPSNVAGMHFPSGFTLYRVKNGAIDAGSFIPLDPPPSR